MAAFCSSLNSYILSLFFGIVFSQQVGVIVDIADISDAGSSLITIVGTKLAGKEPDKKHPFGYGRIEYMSAMLISVIVLDTDFAEE